MIESGFVRLPGQEFQPDAVQWWFFRRMDDGWCFARGGRCRTTREARRLLGVSWNECMVERHRFLRRPTHELQRDGEIIPIRGRSPYEAVKLKEMLG